MGHVIQKQQVQVVQNEPETQSEEVRGQHLSTWLDLMSLTSGSYTEMFAITRTSCNNS